MDIIKRRLEIATYVLIAIIGLFTLYLGVYKVGLKCSMPYIHYGMVLVDYIRVFALFFVGLFITLIMFVTFYYAVIVSRDYLYQHFKNKTYARGNRSKIVHLDDYR